MKLIDTKILRISLFFLFIAVLLSSCVKEDETPQPGEAPLLTQKVNDFILASMDDVYLWEEYLPELDYRFEFDSKAYFDKLLYTEDKWSFITDDIEALQASFNGVETTFGYSLAFGRFSNTGNLFAIVEYVYPNSPASEAGIKRGDIITLLEGNDITDANYRDLFYAASVNITMGVLNEGSISAAGEKSMTSAVLNLDPVVLSKIIEQDGHKIGYLFYAQYIEDYNASVDAALQYFKDNNISDLVLDIRYNPGGYISAAQHLCSSIAPASVVSAEEVLVSLQWNAFYQNYWATNGIDYQIKTKFISNTPVNLDLSKIYILTGSGSASASELTITGLDPYMDVVLLGDTTYGKYTGSITVKPEDIFDDPAHYADIDNWGIQPIVLRYANANGVTDFKNGFAPDFYVYDDLWSGIALGDPTEPIFAKAIEQITGVVKAESFKRQSIPEHTIVGHGFSRFDKQKQNLIINMPNLLK